MPLVYRPARADDLVAADALAVARINDLTVRHGFGPMATANPTGFLLFSFKDDPAGLWIAEDGGAIVGFAWSWVCGDVWFLAQLFIDPAQQGQGIGNEMLARTFEHARASGAVHKALITFTFNRVSQGLTCDTAYFRGCRSISSRPRESAWCGRYPHRTCALLPSTPAPRRCSSLPRSMLAPSACRARSIIAICTTTPRPKACCSAPATIRSATAISALADTSAAGGHARRSVARCVCGGAGACGRPLRRDGLRIPAGDMRQRSQPRGCARHAHHVPNAADGLAGYGDWTHYLPRNPGFM